MKLGDRHPGKNEAVKMTVSGVERLFDIHNPDLPAWVTEHALSSDSYPYPNKLKRKSYLQQLEAVQIELVRAQKWLRESGARVISVFEGCDAAGKGGTIKAFTQYLNPRHTRVIALAKPSDTERGEWYYQRYIKHFPSRGEMVLFDRSWYNRAGVEPVMGFCTSDQYTHFLDETPSFEKAIIRDGIYFFKFWLNVGQETQIKRFHDRRHDPLKFWKLSDLDIEALSRWEDYTSARDRMLQKTHRDDAPWITVKSNDKRRARLNVIRYFLNALPYASDKPACIRDIDPRILSNAKEFLEDTR